MKTLKNSTLARLAGRVASVTHPRGIRDYYAGRDAALEEYGDWRVVEGVLGTIQGPRDRQPIVVLRQPTGSMVEAIGFGALGDTVKLLLPPEEKVQSDPLIDQMRKRIATLEACREIQETREADLRWRADKYEAALREIREHPAISSYMALRDIAREALDDE